MLIYKGRGALIAIFTFLVLLFTELATRRIFHDENYYQNHKWPVAAGFFISATLIWILSQKPMPKAVDATEYIVSSSREISATQHPPSSCQIFRLHDSLFYIPASYWAFILWALALLFSAIPISSLG